ncbi:MAG TPA: malto-oligosyltrehalose synthase [Candidatus Acidoferrales bacterium]|jgi:(1->4)-alpha-D-glucan 1-alpha-D-glucosylmutase|nr:malto-oligosyltrehalose synthase [Candidatus Acidoferrales bacterium]
MPPLNPPLSTYRLQFNKDFGFADATRLLGYLSELGVTDVYASPILTSRKGSEHGYDVADPTRIDPEIGSEQEFEALLAELAKRGMGLLLDIVPNHMAASSENRWWMDVLENGRESAFASYFDIDWNPPSRNLTGRVLLPILGKPFGDVLDQGQLQLTYQDGRFFIRYFEWILPVAPVSYQQILSVRSDAIEAALGKDTPEFQEFSGILAAFTALAQGGRAGGNEARPKLEAMRERLRALVSERPAVAALIESNLKEFNGTAGDAASFVQMDRLLNQQHYLLAYWQDPNEGINYRRFFTISDLVGVRVEDPIVFDATHDHVFRIVAKGASQGLRMGLRIDHIDGLRDPSGYLTRLQQRLSETEGLGASCPYLIVEKILGRGETLPEDWPIAGTTGYEFLNYVNGIFVDTKGGEQIAAIYSQFVGRKINFADVVYEKKKLVMNSLLRVEVRGLARQLAELALKDRYARSISRLELIDGLTEVTACMPVYRTYIRSLDVPPSARATIEEALRGARERRPQLSDACLGFLGDVLMLSNPPHIGPEQREERLGFVMRWQQFTGPIVAKGFEDTALYAYYPLCSLNDVGGDPEPAKAASREEFYEFIRDRQRRWPQTLNATTTHDTKRSEDVRTRVDVLSEIPDEWSAKIDLWSKENNGHKQSINGLGAPDANEEYLIYQTLLGMWPQNATDLSSITKRLQGYMVKALREAKIHTRWIETNEAYEGAVTQFIERILSREMAPSFMTDFAEFQRKLSWCGMMNGLGQTLLKIVCPGTPDFYQGSEVWDLRLVDPDNRGPVDFSTRCRALHALPGNDTNPDRAMELLRRWPDGQIKLHVIRAALRCRVQHAEVFADGDFLPLSVTGLRSENVIPILRRHDGGHCVLAVVPRWLARTYTPAEQLPSADFWGDTALLLPESAPKSWSNVLTGESIEIPAIRKLRSLVISDTLARFPVALLTSAHT